MDRKKSERIQYVIIIVLALIIAGILIYMIPYRYKLNSKVTYEVDSTIVDNPLMGFAPMADNEAYCETANLVFIELTWAEWEPERGQYDIEALETKNNIAKWKSENKHAVLRFVCDLPGETAHMDIPQWLYEKTGDGIEYVNAYGKGYSPDYSNSDFMLLHESAIQALGEYCSRDDFVAYVELGSIGHWGEWHAINDNGENIMPDADVCVDYANQYADSFVNQLLLTRRNYDFSVDNGIGFFNDMVGAYDDTAEWLEWIKNGGIQETSDTPLALKKISNIGMTAPVGGEFTSSVPMEDILGEDFGEILSQISDSAMTFIGPNMPDLTLETNQVDLQSILRRIGYRIYVSSVETKYDFSSNDLNVKLTWKNAGNAGCFFEWPVVVNVYDADKKIVYWQGLDLNLMDLNDGLEKETQINIPYSEEIGEEFYIGITIKNPNAEEYMNMAIKMEEDLGWIDESRIVFHYVR